MKVEREGKGDGEEKRKKAEAGSKVREQSLFCFRSTLFDLLPAICQHWTWLRASALRLSGCIYRNSMKTVKEREREKKRGKESLHNSTNKCELSMRT